MNAQCARYALPTRVWAILFLLLGAMTGAGGARAALISWPEWTVYSSENFQDAPKHYGYPLTFLFDGDPATAWVFSGRPGARWDTADHRLGGGQFVLHLSPKTPLKIDGLRLMNGYNKSATTFKRNNRITHLRVTVFYGAGHRAVKDVTLADHMGWHTIALPRQTVTGITIEMTGFAPGPDKDVCLSELALYDGARKVDMHLPRALVYSDGEGEQYLPEDIVIDRKGSQIATTLEDTAIWNTSGGLIAGVGDKGTVWVVDAHTARVVQRTPGKWETVQWKGNYLLELRDREQHTKTVTVAPPGAQQRP